MVYLRVEPGAAGSKAQTNRLSYGGTPKRRFLQKRSNQTIIEMGPFGSFFLYFRFSTGKSKQMYLKIYQ